PAKRARKAAEANQLQPSIFRPHVPADRRVLLWTAPFSSDAHEAMQSQGIALHLQRRIFETMLHAHVDETRESYGAGLLRYHQFCDREGFGESARMPADRLAAFVADAVGSCTGKCIRNWLNGLRLWHLYNDAPWHGDDGWLAPLKKAADKCGASFKRPPRGPITPAHLRALRSSLDLSSPSGAAHWSAALSAFWGCRRLGEMLIRSVGKFSTLRDTCRNTRPSQSQKSHQSRLSLKCDGRYLRTFGRCEYALFTSAGPRPLAPLGDEHLRINHSPPPNTPLFAFRSNSGWRQLPKDPFLKSTAAVFSAAHLELVFGHSYRIGGSLELLSAGVAPEVIMKLGGWSSLCFLIYWRRLEKILPLAITRAWDQRIREFASAHSLSFDIESLSID
ncbi:hypothetical protein C8J57DRAFT_1564581, partial [Mycena rebaudengoi]